jgi:hypothetical protein
MLKVSTPGDRQHIRDHLPVLMARLESMMPISWNTTVIHILTFHTIDIIERVGPFNVANILDIERFHTLFKKLARGRRHIMTSIKNHYLLLEMSLQARLTEDINWTRRAVKSSMAGYAQRLDSDDRADRMFTPLGAGKPYTIPESDRQQIQSLWADDYPEYFDFHRRFNFWNRQQPRKQRLNDISQWNGTTRTTLTDAEKKWQQMSFITTVINVMYAYIFLCVPRSISVTCFSVYIPYIVHLCIISYVLAFVYDDYVLT